MKHFIFINLFSILIVVGIFYCGYTIGKYNPNKDYIHIDSIDKTYVDWRTILPQDTINFKTAQEEYEFLRDCNRIKYEIDSLQMLCIDVIDALLYDGFDPDQQVSLSQIENALLNNDYFYYLEQIDSIINKECN